MIAAGDLNQRILIEKPIKTTQGSGSVAIGPWQAVIDKPLPARFQPVSGGEVVRGVTLAASTTALFEIRFHRSLMLTPSQVTEYRLRWTSGHSDPGLSPIYNLVRVLDPSGLRQTIYLECREAK